MAKYDVYTYFPELRLKIGKKVARKHRIHVEEGHAQRCSVFEVDLEKIAKEGLEEYYRSAILKRDLLSRNYWRYKFFIALALLLSLGISLGAAFFSSLT